MASGYLLFRLFCLNPANTFSLAKTKALFKESEIKDVLMDIYNELKDDYDISIVQPVDMFPRSFHVETVVGLQLKKR